MNSSRARMRNRLLAIASCLLVGGCSGSGDLKITGKVTVDGKPAEAGTIMFTPADGGTKVAGGVIEGGVYQVELPPGEKVVQLRAMRLVESSYRDEITGQTVSTQNPVRLTDEQYESPRSPLRATVTKAGETFDFDLPGLKERR